MDNKAYLDQIAVKGKVKSGPILSPMLIKIVAAGIVLLITMIIVGSVINSSNAKVTQTFERVYVRMSNFGGDNYENPLEKYADNIRNSDLRSYCGNLRSIFVNSFNDLSGTISSVGVKTESISSKITNEESVNYAAYTAALDEALLAGTFDRTFAIETEYQLATLIQYENEALKKSNNQNFSNVIQRSINDLTTIQQQLKTWYESN